MAIPSEKAVPIEQDTSADFAEVMVDVDDMLDTGEDDSLEESADSATPGNSAELRRKIEERLELKMLKDELGFDDFDL